MEDFKLLSITGMIFWGITIITYFISLLINYFYYLKTSISNKQKVIYERLLKQSRLLVILVRLIVIIFSILTLVFIHFINTSKTFGLMLLLIGLILPAYFLSLIAVKLEEMSLSRPVFDQITEPQIKS
ncbi:MAG: hypothetical protein ACYDEQ_01755 [Desulfocucumaceae bacterium]